MGSLLPGPIPTGPGIASSPAPLVWPARGLQRCPHSWGLRGNSALPSLPVYSLKEDTGRQTHPVLSPQDRGASAPVWEELGRGLRLYGRCGRKEAGGQ